MLYLLRSGFRKDLIVHLLIVVLIGSALSMAAGYLADDYFGKTVSGLIGEYGEFDLLLTVNREVRSSALAQVRDIIRVKLPGSSVQQGVTIAGKTNYFIRLADEFKTREQFMHVDNYFSNVTGLVGVTIMAEPRITVRSIPRGLVDQFEREISAVDGVRFAYPAGSGGIDLMLDSPRDIDPVNKKVKDLLAKYQILEVRFPIDTKEMDTVALGDQLAVDLKEKYSLPFAQNISTNEMDDQQYLVNTMLEMREFLLQYATIVSLPRTPEMDVAREDYLIMPSAGRENLKEGDEITPMDMKLQVIKVTKDTVQALIVEGNASDVQTKDVYKINSNGKIVTKLGEATITSPREDLKYAADELAKVLPDLDNIFTQLYGMTGEAITALEVYSDTLSEVKKVQGALEEGQAKVEGVKNTLTQVDLSKVQDFVSNLLAVVKSAEEVSSKMSWAEKELYRLDNELGQFQGQVDVLKKEFGVSKSYEKQLDQAVGMAGRLQQALQNNTGQILERLTQYNPVFIQIASWRADLEKLNEMVAGGSILNSNANAVTDLLDRVVSSSDTTLNYLSQLDNNKVNEQVLSFKASLEKIQQADVSAIIKELKYISDTLPNLRDEEVTRTINLIEKYMSGQIIPGQQVLILVPAKFDIKETRSFITERVGESISVYSMDAGLLQPNVRGEFLRILSEVRETITALIAIVLVMLVLMLDLTGVMSVVKELRKKKNQTLVMRVMNSELVFGALAGSITLHLIFTLTKGQLPYIDTYPGLILGGLIGLIVAFFADRINPVDKKEYMAGEALGFNFSEILREIIIPSGKPGILYLLNQRNLYFR